MRPRGDDCRLRFRSTHGPRIQYRLNVDAGSDPSPSEFHAGGAETAVAIEDQHRALPPVYEGLATSLVVGLLILVADCRLLWF